MTELQSGRIEDLEWLAETGESVAGAAIRVGLSQDSLAKMLGVAKRHDLWAALKRNETKPWWSGLPSGTLSE